MRYRDAKKLHNGDEVHVKGTDEILSVIETEIQEKDVFVRCTDENRMEKEKNWLWSRDSKMRGEITNLRARRCQMSGCTGWCMHVRWPDGKRTFPCIKGCTQLDDHIWKLD